jgi:hypothetical protein
VSYGEEVADFFYRRCGQGDTVWRVMDRVHRIGIRQENTYLNGDGVSFSILNGAVGCVVVI